MKKGFVLVEIVIFIIVIIFLAIGVVFTVRNVINKAKVVSAKAQISQIALLLEQVKNDTGKYPSFLSDLTSTSPPKLMENGWDGPYTKQIPLDPWGNPYFYKIPPTTLLSSPRLPRVHGKPDTYSANFEGIAGKGKIRIENYGVTSCSIYLNGVEIVKEDEFKNNPRPQIIEKEIDILDNNNTITWARSTPGDFLYFSITADNIPTGEYFMIGSYGSDGNEGGKEYAKDIVWVSNKYPNFQ